MILDTSVIAKWFLEEEDTEKALKIRDRYVRGEINIEIPDLLLYELANVLMYKGYTGEEIKKAIKSIYDMGFLIISPSPVVMDLATEIALKARITIYDATYVALAHYFDTEVVTADKKLYEKTKDIEKVVLLSKIQ